MRIAVVILNWNTVDYLRRFLPAMISGCEGMDAEVIVADSASTDGSAEMVAAEFPDAGLIRLAENYGFTGGYNRALAGVEAEYYVLVNSDIEVPQGWLEPLVQWMESHPDCGVCGPKIHRLLPEGRSDMFEYAGAAGGCIDRFGFPFCRGRVPGRTETDFGQYDDPHDVMWVSGACLMTRASLWKSLNGLDDRFFVHMEEIDYCWRAQLAGWKVTMVPDSTVYHIGGGTLPETSPFKLKLNFRNNLLLLEKNLPATIGAAPARRRIFARKVLDGCAAAVYLLSGHPDRFKAVLEAHREFGRMSGKVSSGAVAEVSGLVPVMIVLQSLLRGKKVFSYLRRYENSH